MRPYPLDHLLDMRDRGFRLDAVAEVENQPATSVIRQYVIDRAVDDVLANFAKGRLIFNLGHGIQPETPIAHVEQMVKRVRAYRG